MVGQLLDLGCLDAVFVEDLQVVFRVIFRDQPDEVRLRGDRRISWGLSRFSRGENGTVPFPNGLGRRSEAKHQNKKGLNTNHRSRYCASCRSDRLQGCRTTVSHGCVSRFCLGSDDISPSPAYQDDPPNQPPVTVGLPFADSAGWHVRGARRITWGLSRFSRRENGTVPLPNAKLFYIHPLMDTSEPRYHLWRVTV